MAMRLNLTLHRPWEDWVLMGLGLLAVISPWLGQAADSQVATLAGMIIGLAILIIASLELTAAYRWEEWTQLGLGVLLFIAPWLLGYSEYGTLTTMHVIIGALVAALAALELWQDGQVERRAA